jgi:hypothetical protein
MFGSVLLYVKNEYVEESKVLLNLHKLIINKIWRITDDSLYY